MCIGQTWEAEGIHEYGGVPHLGDRFTGVFDALELVSGTKLDKYAEDRTFEDLRRDAGIIWSRFARTEVVDELRNGKYFNKDHYDSGLLICISSVNSRQYHTYRRRKS